MPTKQDYSQLVKEKSPNSPIVKNTIMAFLTGGFICLIGEVVKKLLIGSMKLDAVEAGTWTSVALVFLGVLLTALGLYNRIASHAGAGTLVPITGFANAVASPAIEFKSEGVITGMCSKMFVIAGPVIVVATICSVAYGIVLLCMGYSG